MWYRINFNRYATELLPIKLRVTKFIAFIKVLVSPVVSLHNEFLRDQNDDYHKLNHNGQVCYLQKALNDKFDNTERRIFIGNGYLFERDYIYTNPEQKPKFLRTIYLRERVDYADTGVDFIVFVPVSILNLFTEQLKAEINYFKEGVKRYKLVTI